MAIKDDEIKVLQLKLQHKPTLSNDEWSVWEHKTWNVHRGVLCWRPMLEDLTIDELATTVREKVERSFKRSWWRGFGFGVLVVLDAKPDAFKIIDQFIDTRENAKGTWQWVILVFPKANVAVGVHTWTAGYLSSVFQGLLNAWEATGFRAESFKKEPDKLMRFLLAAAGPRLRPAEFDPEDD